MSDAYLLTPGPLTTSRTTKEAMLRDWGSWDADFNAITARIRSRLVAIVHLPLASASRPESSAPVHAARTDAAARAGERLRPARTGEPCVHDARERLSSASGWPSFYRGIPRIPDSDERSN